MRCAQGDAMIGSSIKVDRVVALGGGQVIGTLLTTDDSCVGTTQDAKNIVVFFQRAAPSRRATASSDALTGRTHTTGS